VRALETPSWYTRLAMSPSTLTAVVTHAPVGSSEELSLASLAWATELGWKLEPHPAKPAITAPATATRMAREDMLTRVPSTIILSGG
jgi:hypothetical protein